MVLNYTPDYVPMPFFRGEAMLGGPSLDLAKRLRVLGPARLAESQRCRGIRRFRQLLNIDRLHKSGRQPGSRPAVWRAAKK